MQNNTRIRLGSTVDSPVGPGTVVDRAHGEALVRLDTGTVLDRTHGQWWPMHQLRVTGFNPNASVWRGQRVVRAGDLADRD